MSFQRADVRPDVEATFTRAYDMPRAVAQKRVRSRFECIEIQEADRLAKQAARMHLLPANLVGPLARTRRLSEQVLSFYVRFLERSLSSNALPGPAVLTRLLP